ncbi:AraC family transcriptional regulator [Rufibacter psychrotolerans]|uniref:AraC family transcriptional regulator n=1 Tax=Rufibacter psychrotolerans TaxID=2812556 RepID=UPI0019674B2C|nr:AraC family transcriptional regulator [Rufibacter sp. SYSU D00308]
MPTLPRQEPTISVQLLNMTLQITQEEGLDNAALCQAANLDPTVLADWEARVPFSAQNRLWRAILDQTGNEQFGLLAGERFQPQAASTVAYVMMHAPTLGKAMEKCGQYQALLCDATRLRYHPTKATFTLEFLVPWAPETRYTIDKMVALFTVVMRQMTCQQVAPLQIGFTFPAPADLRGYHRLLPQTEFLFDCPTNYLKFRPQDLALPVRGANLELYRIFEQHAQTLLARHQQTHSITYLVGAELMKLLPAQAPAVEVVAQNLHLSVRSLQLKLQQENTTFQAILNETRKDLAQLYLRERHLSKADIAYLLGFSEISVFSRTFRKWTGVSPSQYQAQLQG